MVSVGQEQRRARCSREAGGVSKQSPLNSNSFRTGFFSRRCVTTAPSINAVVLVAARTVCDWAIP